VDNAVGGIFMKKQNEQMMKKKMRFPVLVTVLLAGVFLFGTIAGAFIYATGSAIIMTPSMVMVSHTEYRYSEGGQIIARLVDFQGNPVVVNNCTATILSPNKATFATGLMTGATTLGDYYYNFTTPAGPEGVYEYQAMCFYQVGINVRNQSVTSSFHLSSAFTNILSNQTAQNLQLTYIQGNLTQVQVVLQSLGDNVTAMNASLGAQITALSGQLNTNVSTILTTMDGNFTALTNQLNYNVTQILAAINNMNISVNHSEVLSAIANLSASMAANFTYTNGLITSVNSTVNALSANMASNFTVVNSELVQINTTANSIYAAVLEINTTTQNTYTYMTTTLATNVNNILSDLGVINATVNRIEVNTQNINTTVNSILQNQQDAVQMSVFSG
jgi:hypothetical protein